MDSTTTDKGSFFSSLQSLGHSLLTLLKDRAELISVELQEEKVRLIQIFVWIIATVFTAFMAITFSSITLVYLFWESARLPALIGLSLFYASAFLMIIFFFRRFLEHQPKPFASSINEIEEDLQCIQPKN